MAHQQQPNEGRDAREGFFHQPGGPQPTTAGSARRSWRRDERDENEPAQSHLQAKAPQEYRRPQVTDVDDIDGEAPTQRRHNGGNSLPNSNGGGQHQRDAAPQPKSKQKKSWRDQKRAMEKLAVPFRRRDVKASAQQREELIEAHRSHPANDAAVTARKARRRSKVPQRRGGDKLIHSSTPFDDTFPTMHDDVGYEQQTDAQLDFESNAANGPAASHLDSHPVGNSGFRIPASASSQPVAQSAEMSKIMDTLAYLMQNQLETQFTMEQLRQSVQSQMWPPQSASFQDSRHVTPAAPQRATRSPTFETVCNGEASALAGYFWSRMLTILLIDCLTSFCWWCLITRTLTEVSQNRNNSDAGPSSTQAMTAADLLRATPAHRCPVSTFIPMNLIISAFQLNQECVKG